MSATATQPISAPAPVKTAAEADAPVAHFMGGMDQLVGVVQRQTELVRAGKLTHEMAMDRSHDPDELTRLLGSKPQVSESFAMGGAMTGGAAMGSPAIGGGTMGGYSG